MKIENLRIQNYKSWIDSGELTLHPGRNIIIGQNNAGKSSLLEILSLTGGHKPHRSLETAPDQNSQTTRSSKLQLKVSFSKGEIMLILRGASRRYFIPSNNDDPVFAKKNFNDWVSDSQKVSADFDNNSLVRAEPENFYGDYSPGFTWQNDPANDEMTFVTSHIHLGDNLQQLFFYQLMEIVRNRLFIFHAERYNLANATVNSNSVLSPRADNLAQVLNHLMSSDRERFDEFFLTVQKVLPQVKGIIVPPMNSNSAQIRVWNTTPIRGRGDLAVPLSDCGTGVGQVLAMIYVIVASNYPQIILIDEPQSFLHPGAVRALMEILEEFNTHQYIIATHSPALLHGEGKLISIQHDGRKSSAEMISLKEAEGIKNILEDLGTRVSDVYGADRILWVEGLTEERCLKLIVSKMKVGSQWKTEILGVRNTGDLSGRNAEAAYEIYKKLSNGSWLIPSVVYFFFDKDGRSEQECKELAQRSGGTIHFTVRRMFENYLLNCTAIAELLGEISGEPVGAAQVKHWITSNGLRSKFIEKENLTEVFSEKWLQHVDGAKLLKQLFADLTDHRYAYEKVNYGYNLTEKILRTAPSDFQQVTDSLKTMLN